MDTVALRLAKYQRRVRLQGLLGAAIAAGMGVFTAIKFAEGSSAPLGLWAYIGPLLLTLGVLAGVCLFLARGSIEWQVDLIARNLPSTAGGTVSGNAAGQNAMTHSRQSQTSTAGGTVSRNAAVLEPTMLMSDAAPLVKDLTVDWPTGARRWYSSALALIAGSAGMLLIYIWLPVFQAKQEPPQPELIGLPVSIHFEVDRAVVPLSLRPPLEDLARRLTKYRNIGLLVEGHADSAFTSQYNLELSRLRAEAVKMVLTEAGFDGRRIRVVGYGDTRPAHPSPSAAGKAQNRRVDVTIVRVNSSTRSRAVEITSEIK